MYKQWFVWIEGKQEGPYNISELKSDSRLTPDTLVWKEGFKEWLPIRRVPELKEIFNDERGEPKPLHEDFKPKPLPSDEEALTIQQDPFQFYLWLLVLILILLYIFFYLNWDA